MADKFWYSENQRKWLDYIDANPLFGVSRPPHGRSYAVIDGCLLEYTECYSGNDPDYTPNYDDVQFLGRGEYACNDLNIQTYIRKHPELHIGKREEWPEFVA